VSGAQVRIVGPHEEIPADLKPYEVMCGECAWRAQFAVTLAVLDTLPDAPMHLAHDLIREHMLQAHPEPELDSDAHP
jgi:hypothetical protein